MGTAREARSVVRAGAGGGAGWFLLRSARAQGTSTFAQSNGPHSAREMMLAVTMTTEVAAVKLNIFAALKFPCREEEKFVKLETFFDAGDRALLSIGRRNAALNRTRA